MRGEPPELARSRAAERSGGAARGSEHYIFVAPVSVYMPRGVRMDAPVADYARCRLRGAFANPPSGSPMPRRALVLHF